MPKAAVHENYLSESPKDNVRRAWQFSAMQSVAISHAMHDSPHHEFRLRVLAANAAHSFAALGFGEGVRHRLSPYPCVPHNPALYP